MIFSAKRKIHGANQRPEKFRGQIAGPMSERLARRDRHSLAPINEEEDQSVGKKKWRGRSFWRQNQKLIQKNFGVKLE